MVTMFEEMNCSMSHESKVGIPRGITLCSSPITSRTKHHSRAGVAHIPQLHRVSHEHQLEHSQVFVPYIKNF